MKENIRDKYIEALHKAGQEKQSSQRDLEDLALEMGILPNELDEIRATAQENLSLSRKYLGSGELSSWETPLNEALTLLPLDPKALLAAAEIYFQAYEKTNKGNYKKKAKELAKRSLEMDESEDAWNLLSQLNSKRGGSFKWGLLVAGLVLMIGFVLSLVAALVLPPPAVEEPLLVTTEEELSPQESPTPPSEDDKYIWDTTELIKPDTGTVPLELDLGRLNGEIGVRFQLSRIQDFDGAFSYNMILVYTSKTQELSYAQWDFTLLGPQGEVYESSEIKAPDTHDPALWPSYVTSVEKSVYQTNALPEIDRVRLRLIDSTTVVGLVAEVDLDSLDLSYEQRMGPGLEISVAIRNNTVSDSPLVEKRYHDLDYVITNTGLRPISKLDVQILYFLGGEEITRHRDIPLLTSGMDLLPGERMASGRFTDFDYADFPLESPLFDRLEVLVTEMN